MHKFKLFIGVLSITFGSYATADTLSVSAGAGTWVESPSGGIYKEKDPNSVDVEKDLFWTQENQGYYFLTFEHFVPLVPNVRVIATKIQQNGKGSASFTFAGKTFGGDVKNNVTLTTTELIAYYEVLDNFVSLDAGIVVKKIDLDYDFRSSSTTVNDSVSTTLPLLYAMAGATPWPGITLSGEISYIGLSDSSISDISAKVSYVTNFNAGAEIGYRTMKYELNDVSDNNINFTFDGIFIGVFLKF